MMLEELLDKLDGVRPGGNGYVARCPSHEDREASLGVTESDGRILVTCYAGCQTEDVLHELALSFSDLFTEKQSSKSQEPEAIYDYKDEDGKLLFQVVRFPGKRFRQRHQDPDHDKADAEGWVWNLEDVRRVPYRLPEILWSLMMGETIYITEGEKDADNLAAVGKASTTFGAAGKWRPEFADFFKGAKTVVIVADRDEVGRNNANAIKAGLEEVAEKIHIVQARAGKDASDHLAAGFKVEDFKVIRNLKRGIVTAAELAEHARERLEMTETDLPGYLLCNEVPLVWRPGRMYAVGAYTGDGKTSLALQGLRELSAAGKRIGYFSLEMPEIDLMNRLIAHRGVPLRFTENPWLLKTRPDLLALYDQAVCEVETWNSDIVFDSAATAESIRERTIDREYEVIFVDHLHRFAATDRMEIGDQVKSLTNIALELNVMVVVLCQLRKTQRGKDFDTYPKPTLQDFRETSQIGDDASMALAVWRQRSGDGLSYTGVTEIVVLKNRHTTGAKDAAGHSFTPHFDPSLQMFTPVRAPVAPAQDTGGF